MCAFIFLVSKDDSHTSIISDHKEKSLFELHELYWDDHDVDDADEDVPGSFLVVADESSR